MTKNDDDNNKNRGGKIIDVSEIFSASGVPAYKRVYGCVDQVIPIGEKNRLLLIIRSGGKDVPLLLDYNNGVGGSAPADFVPPLVGDAVSFKLLPGRVRTQLMGYEYVPTVFVFENIGEHERERAAQFMRDMKKDPHAQIIPFKKK